MKRLLLAVALVLLTAASGVASHLDRSTLGLVRWAGCSADLTTSDEVGVEGSGYSPSEHRLYIGTAPGAPDYVRTVVVLHEIGHCLQAQEGILHSMPAVESELDADRRAADLACALELDGARLLHDAMVWAHETFGYDGDPGHGTLAERISTSDLAYSCRVPPLQS